MKIKTKFYLYFIIAGLLPLVAVLLWQYYVLLSLFAIILFIGLYFIVYKDFLKPFNDIWQLLYNYQAQHSEIKQDLSSFTQISTAINYLLDESQYLYDDMEDILKKQVERLSKKTASLEILYSMSNKINTINDYHQLFEYFLAVFMKMTKASSGVGRRLNKNGKLVVVVKKNITNIEHSILLNNPCSSADGVQFSIYNCENCLGANNNLGTIFIPLSYKNKVLGVFNLFFAGEPSLAFDERQLMQTIANNIAQVLDKIKVNNKNKLIELTQERLYLSQEIHDSLAQTIYSINLQVNVLQKLLVKDDKKVQDKIIVLQQNIVQANKELRELINNFRTPIISNYNYLEKLINEFKQETDIKINAKISNNTSLNEQQQQQIIRIVSEALMNIKKHANAKNVHIICNNKQLIIEDDGIGFIIKNDNKKDHIGLKIMRERAKQIGAKIKFNSAKGIGTSIIIDYE